MYPPHHLGGYELSCRDVVERWRTGGHAVEVYTTTMRVTGVDDDPGEPSKGIHRDLEFYWRDYEMIAPSIYRRHSIERGNQAVLQNAIDRFQPEVVSVWHMGAMSMGLLSSVLVRDLPMVLVVCDDWLLYGPQVDPWLNLFHGRKRLGRIVHRLTGLPTTIPELDRNSPACFVSDWMKRRSEELSLIPLSETTVVYSGIDTGDFPIRKSSRRDWRWRLLCVGRQEQRKGTHVAVEAMKQLPTDAQLDVLGPGDEAYLAGLRDEAAAAGLDARVRFDQVPRERLRHHYEQADAFVFPVIWDEPFGLVPLEAMACGVPVIATGTGGSAEFLINGVNCLLVPRNDAAAIAHAATRLAKDSALREALVHAGWTTAEELTVDRLARTLETWHESAAERFANGRPEDLPAPVDALRRRANDRDRA